MKPLQPTPGHTLRTEPNMALVHEINVAMAETEERCRREMGEEAYAQMMRELDEAYEGSGS